MDGWVGEKLGLRCGGVVVGSSAGRELLSGSLQLEIPSTNLPRDMFSVMEDVELN